MWFLFITVTITTQQNNVKVCSRGDAVLTCILSGQSITRGQITTAEWHIKRIENNTFLLASRIPRHNINTTIVDGKLFDMLTVTNVSDEDEGLYRCVVPNKVTSKIVSITVEGE